MLLTSFLNIPMNAKMTNWFKMIHLRTHAMDNSLRLAAVCALMLVLMVTISTSAPVYAQTTGDMVSTQKWCENKKDELKDRLTDLVLLSFAEGATYNMVIDIRDKGNALVAETAEKMIDCADYLTGTEIQTLQQMHDAAAFFACMGDTILKIFLGQADTDFINSYYTLVNATTDVTEKYHTEIEKWEEGEYSDQQLVSITNSYLSEFDKLVDEASNIDAPEKFQDALDLYIESLNFERTSYALFRDFVETGDPKLNETSIDSLSNATNYELESFALVQAGRNTDSGTKDLVDPNSIFTCFVS
jgi:hypothetical protein